MTEEIIIDGINVASCEYCFKRDNTACCSDYITGLCEDYNCYYKQLKRLEQENERYKSALEEIRDYLNTLSSIDSDFVNTETYIRINDKINEVLG